MTEEARLGKGLAALISSQEISNESGAYNENFDITKIEANPYQPRMHIKPEDLIELADSIREHGVIQPLIITKAEKSDKYYLIAGERRFRASQLAGLKKVPVVIKEASPQKMLELALIENIQREDLNAVEEALAFKQLQEEFGLKQTEIAKKVGLSRVAVTNKIRILGLPEEVKEAILNGKITEGHARALLGLADKDSIVAAMDIVIKRELSVRDTEAMVRKINYGRGTTRKKLKQLDQETEDIAKRISKKLGAQAKIVPMSRGGKITIRFASKTELRDILKKIS
jgi:ParB family chromosome partitioning protein